MPPRFVKPKRDTGKRKYVPRKKFCAFCADKVVLIDYKDPSKLQRYISDRARMEPRRKTGVCAKHQRRLGTALKRARHLAMLPFTPEHARASGGIGLR